MENPASLFLALQLEFQMVVDVPALACHFLAQFFHKPVKKMKLGKNIEPVVEPEVMVSRVHRAAREKNIVKVHELIKLDENVIVQQEENHGQTLLHVAVRTGELQLVEMICRACSKLSELINLRDYKGNTPLHFAAAKHLRIAHYLLEHGADPNIENEHNNIPLQVQVMCAQKDDPRMTKLLLKYKTIVDSEDVGQVLHLAIEKQFFQILHVLIAGGTRMDVKDDDDRVIFDKLSRTACREALKYVNFPPKLLSKEKRKDCMLCKTKIKLGHRKSHCTHCGRVCCTPCASMSIEMHKFPAGFPGRITGGAHAVNDMKRVCKTCYNILKGRFEQEHPNIAGPTAYNRYFGVEWEEMKN